MTTVVLQEIRNALIIQMAYQIRCAPSTSEPEENIEVIEGHRFLKMDVAIEYVIGDIIERWRKIESLLAVGERPEASPEPSEVPELPV